MSNSNSENIQYVVVDEVFAFIKNSSGLSYSDKESKIVVLQKIDNKSVAFQKNEITEVLNRVDSEGRAFIQLNFKSNKKILLTDTLIGFKPVEIMGLDTTKIPKVVTTPDLLSVFEAIEDSLSSDTTPDSEVEVLKRVYQSILSGAESIGFDLKFERSWLNRITASKFKASA